MQHRAESRHTKACLSTVIPNGARPQAIQGVAICIQVGSSAALKQIHNKVESHAMTHVRSITQISVSFCFTCIIFTPAVMPTCLALGPALNAVIHLAHLMRGEQHGHAGIELHRWLTLKCNTDQLAKMGFPGPVVEPTSPADGISTHKIPSHVSRTTRLLAF